MNPFLGEPFAEVSSASPGDVDAAVNAAAARLGVKAFELDWRIWEASRGGALFYPTAPT